MVSSRSYGCLVYADQIVRMSAKELTSLILDEERLRTERSDRKNWKSRVTGIEDGGPQGSGYAGGSGGSEPPTPHRRRNERRQQRPDEEDAEYKLAIEASKFAAEEDQKRRDRNSAAPVDDDDLAKAIRLSKEEEELRRRELEETNATSLFDDSPAQTQPTGNNQGYQQQGAVDWFGNPVDPNAQIPQNTGYPGNAYAQPAGFQNQQTGFSNVFQPQQTGFDPTQYQQQTQPSYSQPQSNYSQSQQTLQPQQTAFNGLNNPYGQQPVDLSNHIQQQQQAAPPQAGSHNPWASGQQQQYESLKPTPTGSNNPFASAINRPQAQLQKQGPPSLISLAEQQATTQFNQQSYNPASSYASSPAPPTPQKDINPQHARLNALLATGEGTDTFGNVGDLRIPAQHTAPGTFVNSAGQGLSRLHAAQTGNNPFFNQQFTGAQQQSSGFGSPQQRMVPAQTGPAGINGYGGSPFAQTSNNPFGPPQSQQGKPQQESLIDIL